MLSESSHAYGVVLAMILVSLAFQMGAPEEDWARMVSIGLQGATLLAALRVSGAHTLLFRVAAVITVLAVLGSAGVLAGSGELDSDAVRSVGLLLAAVAPVAIAIGVVREARTHGVTFRTMFGVLCMYLLLGNLYAYVYAVIAALSSEHFFAETSATTISDFLYFSFTTMTTTGFGDLTAATDAGRAVAVTEELAGQIYLVTVVAVIVSNLGRQPRSRSPRAE